jgi:TRAP-type transport system periplasmic protein
VRTRSWTWRAILLSIVAVVTAVGFAACGSDSKSSGTSSGGDGEKITLKLAYVTTQQHPYGIAIDAFAKDVAAASNGRITISPLPSYPQSEIQLLSDVRGGTVDMATISTAVWDSQGINAFQALQAPFLINNYGLEGAIINGDIGKKMATEASTKAGDIQVLAIHEGGLRKPLGTKKALTSPADFKGLKIRAVQSKVLAAGLKALGAEPDPIPLPDVYQALQNGTVDGMEANLGLIAANKYYEVAKYVTGNVNFWPFPTALTINKATLDTLSAEDQKILTDAAAKVPAQSLGIVSAKSTLPQGLVDCGIQFVTASDADKAALEAAGQTAIAELSKDPLTGGFITDIQAVKKATPPGAAPPPFPTEKSAPGAKCALGG